MRMNLVSSYTEIEVPGWQRVVLCQNKQVGFEAYISIHSTQRGPSLGGCRMWPYATRQDALTDSLRLSKGMTYKSIWAGLPLGGGKSCIIGNPKTEKSEELFKAMGDFVERFCGEYIIAEDVGTTLDDLTIVGQNTTHIASTNGSGDPSPMTAYACFRSIKDTCYWKLGINDIAGIRVGVLGLGKVGYPLVEHLIESGVFVFGADIDKSVLIRAEEQFGDSFTSCTEDELINMELDVFSPCALGGILNHETVKRLNSLIVAGSANNQLLTPEAGEMLHYRDILYAPDYVINAGGLINVFCEVDGPYNPGRAKALAGRVSGNLINIYERSAKDKKPTYLVADEMAEEVLNGKKAELSI